MKKALIFSVILHIVIIYSVFVVEHHHIQASETVRVRHIVGYEVDANVYVYNIPEVRVCLLPDQGHDTQDCITVRELQTVLARKQWDKQESK